MILFFVPDTKDLSLEELDQVFGYSTREHVRHGVDQLRWFVSRYVLRRKGLKKPVFVQREDPEKVFDTRGEVGDGRGAVYEEVREEKESGPAGNGVFVG